MEGKQDSKENATAPVSALCGLQEQEAIMCLAYILLGTHNFTPEEIISYQAMAKKFCSAELDLMNCQNKFHDMLKDHRNDDIIRDCLSVIRPKYRETVFAWLIDGVAADDHFTYDEEDYINILREEIGISPERSAQIMEVMSIKNKKYKHP